ncbi:DNA methyltransferase [Magnetospira sp. QH-2]|uniref:DNA methyltransferase n=1 Tax=Magnetospira sp. (strain QH-2) TaxID=1288970 RepID=UPI0003E81BF3|nr:DNA methyltransferase [Magnetospira sp. QH-2]CCQ72777.1 putative Site-specific DNA-methyltransferase (cytosine-N(4)-specific) [Magnetospira sp. QH-2]
MLIRLADHQRTPLAYPGGKAKMAETLSGLRPDGYREYRECFAGGAAMFFHIRRHHPCERYWINDLDPQVFAFHNILQQQPADLIGRLLYLYDIHGGGSEDLYRQWLDWNESEDLMDTAVATFLKHQIVRGTKNTGYGFARKRVEAGEAVTRSKIERLNGFSELLQGIHITCQDYRDVLSAPGNDVFCFADPPYEEVGNRMYEFGDFDLEGFTLAVEACQHDVLITLNDSRTVREAFSQHRPIVHQVGYSVSGNQQGQEVIIPTYQTPLLDIYARQIGERLPEPVPAVANDNDARPLMDCVFNQSCEDMSLLPDDSIHLTVTSPPYNVGIGYGENTDDDRPFDDYLDWLRKVFVEIHRVTVVGGRVCININNTGRSPYIPLTAHIHLMMEEVGFLPRGEIIWNKGGGVAGFGWGSHGKPSNPVLRDVHEYVLVFSKGDYCRTDLRDRYRGIKPISSDDFADLTRSIWNITPEKATRVGHPVPFPVELPRRLIKLYSGEGDLVLDPFMGSGTTGVAAVELDRRYLGFELEGKFIKLAEQRIAAARANRKAA